MKDNTTSNEAELNRRAMRLQQELSGDWYDPLYDKIERLRAENKRLRAANKKLRERVKELEGKGNV